MSLKFGFIGAGNMGGTLAMCAAKAVGGENVLLSDADHKKAQALAEKIGANAVSNTEAVAICDYIFLGVKPQVLPEVLKTLAEDIKNSPKKPVLVSMAAGVSVDSVLSYLGENWPVIRIMPNTPAAYGEGMILYTQKGADDKVDGFLKAMSTAGKLDEIPEKLIDAASAVSGCGPAFAYMFIEALADGGVECGLPYNKALEYAAQTVLGAAKTVRESGVHPEALKNAVCSPGGTTICGVHALEKGAMRATAMNAVKAAYDKTLKLAGK